MYVMLGGPTYETVAELRLLRMLGEGRKLIGGNNELQDTEEQDIEVLGTERQDTD